MATVFGTGGDDTLIASEDSDQLYGIAGNDVLTTRYDDVLLSGGSGSDRLLAINAAGLLDPYGEFVAGSTLYGGSGIDHLFASGILSLSAADPDGINGYLARYIADGGVGDDIVHVSSSVTVNSGQNQWASVYEQLIGGDGNDDLSATGLVDTSGSSGSIGFSLEGDQGDDTMHAVSYSSDAGVTSFISETGGAGNDSLSAFSTGYSIDVIQAGDGNDTALIGAHSNEYISIGVEGNAGKDHIYVNATLGGEADELDIDVSGDAGFYPLGGGDSDVIQINAAATTADTYQVMQIAASGGEGDDRILAFVSAASAADSVTLSLDGGSGDDFIRGAISTPGGTGSHSETLTGDDGNDRLIARGDVDALIWGGEGSDVLTGGGGADTFHEDYSALADGVRDTDVVTNYSMAEGDVIDLPNGIEDVASWRVIDGNTRLTLVGDHDVLVLRGVSVTDLHTDVLFA